MISKTRRLLSEDLQREVKAAEENYLLYLQKREEARIADALDKSHILNVAIAEPPNGPCPAQALTILACPYRYVCGVGHGERLV